VERTVLVRRTRSGTSFIDDELCFVNFYKMLNFHNIVRNCQWKTKVKKNIILFKTVTHNISDYFRQYVLKYRYETSHHDKSIGTSHYTVRNVST
jgi:hypothetical protein